MREEAIKAQEAGALGVIAELNRYLPILLMALLWEAVARLGLVSSLALPPLSKVVVAWFDLMQERRTGQPTAPPRSIAPPSGSLLSVVVGAVLGIVMAWWRPANLLLSPLVEIFYPMPKSALIPVTVIWLGFGDGSKILLIFLGCMLPVTHRRVQRRALERPRAGVVGPQHGRESAAHAVGRGRAERAAGAPQRHPHRAWRCRSSCW